MVAGIDQPMVLPDQLVAAVAADIDKLLIAVQNLARTIRDGHDRRLVQRGGQTRATRPVDISHVHPFRQGAMPRHHQRFR
ncbi:hypothetical protein D3C71_1876600 [compost metagenome]